MSTNNSDHQTAQKRDIVITKKVLWTSYRGSRASIQFS